MKKKKIKMLIVIVLILITSGCGKKEKTYIEKKQEEHNQAVAQRTEKLSVIEKKDGWYHYFLITDLGEQNDKIYGYNGCSLKYNKLDGYNVLVMDEQNNVISRIPTYPSLIVSEKSVSGVMEKDEISMISDYFNNKQFSSKIQLSDLNDLSLVNFSKEEIVNLYNEAIKEDGVHQIGKYNFSDCSVFEEKTESKEKFQIGVLINFGVLKKLRIDIKYDDGSYLSDLIENNTATQEQKEMYKSFDEIENYMLKSQKFDIKEHFPKYNTESYTRLFQFLKNQGEN